MDSRSVVTALLNLCLVASHNVYLFGIRAGYISVIDQRAFYSGELLAFSVPLIYMGNSNYKSDREIEFRKIGWLIVSVIMSFIILNRLGLIPLPHLQVYYFNGITFAYVLYALLFSDRSGNL